MPLSLSVTFDAELTASQNSNFAFDIRGEARGLGWDVSSWGVEEGFAAITDVAGGDRCSCKQTPDEDSFNSFREIPCCKDVVFSLNISFEAGSIVGENEGNDGGRDTSG